MNLFDEFISSMQSPSNIFYGPYIISSYLLVLIAMIASRKFNIRSALGQIFDRKIWLSRGARTDFVVSLVYLLFFNIPTNIAQASIAFYFYDSLSSLISTIAVPTFYLPVWIESIFACIVIILAFDFATYLSHRAMHSSDLLWSVHVVHHSPRQLNIFSAYRQNPLDRLLRNALGGVFVGVSMAILHSLFPQRAPEATIMGLGAGFFLFMLTVHLQHMHIPVHYPRWLANIFLSPHLHQIHHSAEARHLNRNFGGIFPYWDRLFGTYHDERLEVGSIRFGINSTDPIEDSIWRCYVNPINYVLGRTQSLKRSLTSQNSSHHRTSGY
jgi:sterol desaturase/sphingolipid hydroxylase (fatty acid hydroxylase superfamily)